MKSSLVKSCLLLVFVILNCPGQDIFSKGEVIERVKVLSDQTESYALYLPKDYTPEKKWAVLYAFEPIARGKLPVTIFQAAAEKYGFILIGSYDSRNGLDGAALSKILKDLWADTHQRFSIDDTRVYATGFSGGARVASLFAASCGCVTGVIGSGAGFPEGLKPSANLSFIYFNAIGFDDYNYYEIRSLKKSLEETGMTHRVERFEGAHQWLPKDLAENALAWMQLYAMKRGNLPKDERFIEDNFQSRIVQAESYFSKNQYLEAFQDYSDIVRDFKDFRDVSELEKRVEELQNSEELKKSLREEERQIKEQERHTAFLFSTGNKLLNYDERINALQEFRSYVANLQKKADQDKDSPARRVARRSLNEVFAATYETAVFTHERAKKYALALVNFEIANEIYPKSPRIPYDRARVYALSGQTKKALEYLEKAVGFGFRNWQEMEGEKAFEKIRQEKKFQSSVARAKNNSAQ